MALPPCFAAAEEKLGSFAEQAPHLHFAGGHQQLQDAEAGFRYCVDQKRILLQQAAEARQCLETAATMTQAQREELALAQQRYDDRQRAAEEAWLNPAANEGRRIVLDNASAASQSSVLDSALRGVRSEAEQLEARVAMSATDVKAASRCVEDALAAYDGALAATGRPAAQVPMKIVDWQVVRFVIFGLKGSLTTLTARSSLLSKPRIANLDATKKLLGHLDALDKERLLLSQPPAPPCQSTSLPDYTDAIAETRKRLSCCADAHVSENLEKLKLLLCAQRQRGESLGREVGGHNAAYAAAVSEANLSVFDAKVSTRIRAILDQEIAVANVVAGQSVDNTLAKERAVRLDELHSLWLRAKEDLDNVKRRHEAIVSSHNAAVAERESLARALASLHTTSEEQVRQLGSVKAALQHARQEQENAEAAFHDLITAMTTTADVQRAEDKAMLKTVGVDDVPVGLDEEVERIVARVRKFAETKELSDYVNT